MHEAELPDKQRGSVLKENESCSGPKVGSRAVEGREHASKYAVHEIEQKEEIMVTATTQRPCITYMHADRLQFARLA